MLTKIESSQNNHPIGQYFIYIRGGNNCRTKKFNVKRFVLHNRVHRYSWCVASQSYYKL